MTTAAPHSASSAPAAPELQTTLPQTGAPVPPHRDGIFSALRNRNFRWFVFGQAMSTSGLWTQRVAQNWLVLTITHNPFVVGVATAMQFVPTLIFGMAAGLVADRFDKRHVLMGTVSTLGLCAVVLGVLCVTDTVRL